MLLWRLLFWWMRTSGYVSNFLPKALQPWSLFHCYEAYPYELSYVNSTDNSVHTVTPKGMTAGLLFHALGGLFQNHSKLTFWPDLTCRCHSDIFGAMPSIFLHLCRRKIGSHSSCLCDWFRFPAILFRSFRNAINRSISRNNFWDRFVNSSLALLPSFLYFI